MRIVTKGLLTIGALALGTTMALAQPPGGRPGDRGGEGSGRMPPNMLLEVLDINKDGAISADEIKNAAEALLKLDRNKDGKITDEEMRPQGPQDRRPGGPGGERPDDRRPGGERPPEGGRPGGERPPEGGGRPGGPGGPGGPGFMPGAVLPPMVRERLDLTDDQVKQIADLATDGDTVRLPPVLFQPMASEDVAKAVGRTAVGAPVNGIVEVGGPEQFRMDELVRRALRARNDPREVITDPDALYFGAYPVDDGTLVPAGDAQVGEVRFRDWLERQLAAA